MKWKASLPKIHVKFDHTAIFPVRLTVPKDNGFLGQALNKFDDINKIPGQILKMPENFNKAAESVRQLGGDLKPPIDTTKTLLDRIIAILNAVHHHGQRVFLSLKGMIGSLGAHVLLWLGISLVIGILVLVATLLVAKIYRTLRPAGPVRP